MEEEPNLYTSITSGSIIIPEVVGLNPTGVRDIFSFSVWAHLLSRAFAQKVLFGIFIRALQHHYIYSGVCLVQF